MLYQIGGAVGPNWLGLELELCYLHKWLVPSSTDRGYYLSTEGEVLPWTPAHDHVLMFDTREAAEDALALHLLKASA